MNTAIDTSIIVYVLAGASDTSSSASRALSAAARRGGAIVVAAPVYAELLALPGWAKPELDAFIADAGLRIDWELTRECWISAGEAFRAYARRRVKQKIPSPRRILADFLIGAHARSVGCLLTADTGFYRTNFPGLSVSAP